MFSSAGERRNSRLLQVKQYLAEEYPNCSSSSSSSINNNEKSVTKVSCESQLFNSRNKSSTKSENNNKNPLEKFDDDDGDGDNGYNIEENVDNNDDIGSSNYQVKRTTPILYSTNRGLHLRLTKLSVTNLTKTSSSVAYDLRFCDLERWNTNRANNINLEESSRTFTITPPPPKSSGAASISDTLQKNFVPIKGPFYFNSHFARFDIK